MAKQENSEWIILWEEFWFNVDKPGGIFSIFPKAVLDEIIRQTAYVAFIQGSHHGDYRNPTLSLDEDILSIVTSIGTFESKAEAEKRIHESKVNFIEFLRYGKKRATQVPQRK